MPILRSVKSAWHGRNAIPLVGLLAAILLVFASARVHPAGGLAADLVTWFRQLMYWPLQYRVFGMIFTPAFAVIMIVTLALERLFPALPNRKLFSVSIAQDFVWFFYEGILHALIVATYISALAWLYSLVAPASPLIPLDVLPEILRVAIAILLVDFCYYLQHRCNHAVPWFWQLHTVHHSQRQLNFFTDFRYHVLEYLVRETFLAVPFIVMGLSVPEIVYVSVLLRWYTRFYHANIRTDLWLLRYVLVTPQSHRIHHSSEERHQGRNFGALFSIWDFMLGTQYRKWDEYPETGIADTAFPHEKQADLASLLLTPLKQMMYPLHQLGRSAPAPAMRSGTG